MKLNKCFFCNKLTQTPFHVTEFVDGKVDSTFDMCKRCADEYLVDKKPGESKDGMDLTVIKTTQDLLNFIANISLSNKKPSITCGCGTTEQDFEQTGRFGCPKCYDTFQEKIEQLVLPYHGAKQHVGKSPHRATEEQWESTDTEKLKLLKLQRAKAIELEEYEKAGELNKQIQDLNLQHP